MTVCDCGWPAGPCRNRYTFCPAMQPASAAPVSETPTIAMGQVCLDMHAALGVRWGDDPYSRIAALLGAERELAAANAALDELQQHYAGTVERMREAEAKLDAANAALREAADRFYDEGGSTGYGTWLHEHTAAIDAARRLRK